MEFKTKVSLPLICGAAEEDLHQVPVLLCLRLDFRRPRVEGKRRGVALPDPVVAPLRAARQGGKKKKGVPF